MRSFAQQRLDLPDYQNLQTLIQQDFQYVNKFLNANENFIISGFTVEHVVPPSLNISIVIANGVVMLAEGDGNMFVVPSGTSALDITVLDGTTTYVWLTLSAVTGENAIRTFWDPAANDGAGAEFTQAVDTQSTYELSANTSTVGFPAGDDTVIHICTVVASGGDITSIIDHRKMLFRLGRGGDTIDQTYDYPFSEGSTEPDPDLEVDGAAFVSGDKQLATFKDWMDAVMTSIKSIKGTTYWTDTASTSLNVGGIAMTGGGTFAWDSGTGVLSWSAAITFLIPQTAFTNTVAIGNLTFSADDQIAYVDIDLTSNAALTPTVVAAAAFTPASGRLIIARRISSVAYVGLD